MDADGHILLCLGGFPNDGKWGKDVEEEAHRMMQSAAVDIYGEEGWQREARGVDGTPRRGGHHAESVGPSMGGGQPYPMNLAHTARLLAIFTALFASKPFERIAGWTNSRSPPPQRAPSH